MIKKKTKPKKKTVKLSTLRNKLDILFSKWVRLSESGEDGYGACVSCGKVDRWQDMDAGHFVSRKHVAYRWSPINCHTQCRYCNRFSSDHLIAYTLWMRDRYGDLMIAELLDSKHHPHKWLRWELEDMIDDYARKLADLAMGYVEETPTAEWQRNHVS